MHGADLSVDVGDLAVQCVEVVPDFVDFGRDAPDGGHELIELRVIHFGWYLGFMLLVIVLWSRGSSVWVETAYFSLALGARSVSI